MCAQQSPPSCLTLIRHLPATTVHHNVILVSIHVNAAGNGSKWLNATGWSCMLPLFVQVTAFAKICC